MEPKVLNGSQPVTLDEINEQQAAEQALAKAERIRIGRPKISAGASRRIVVQQRIRVQPESSGFYRSVTIAPSPLLTVNTRGRISVYVLLPFRGR